MSTLKLFKQDFYERIGGLKIFKDLVVLDLGCGEGEDSVNISKFAKKVIGVDIYSHPNWRKISQMRIKKNNIKFQTTKAEKLPFKNQEFSGLFLKDVLHHVDDIEKVMKEIKRVTTGDAKIILIEGNRYNPLFYIHMTKLKGHEHLTQEQFKNLVLKHFPKAQFIHFESHFIPLINEKTFKFIIILEKIIDSVSFFRPILSYNMAKITLV